ncbi:hypothetical protein Tsubulata_046753 [Turnera subulata]|uniref:Glycosyltransferase n=1 Tax=Turnera subulata TaxID=218843 RepID=A0A9Q0FYD3_9ROSI|nr:hypothetical protein Tsubulata_046753 [Turnera subulata]
MLLNLDQSGRFYRHLTPHPSDPIEVSFDNLPQDSEATSDVPLKDVAFLEDAYDALHDSLAHFLQSSLPDWILCDFAAYWVPPLARRLNVPSCFFSIFTAATLGFMSPPSAEEDYRRVPEDLAATPKWVNFPTTVAYRYFEASKIGPPCLGWEPHKVGVINRFHGTLRGCDLIAVRTFKEFEAEWLKLLERIHLKPALPVGVLAPKPQEGPEDDDDASWRSIKDWLDNQTKGSVVYVAFGSEAKPSQEELTEIALGLELSGVPFFWVLRKRRGSADTEVVELPEGFEERVKGRGVVSTGWVPQLKILAHDSVGGFLTHSGWSSVVEALQFEKALVLLTFYADQGLNAKLFQEQKIGYLIPREERDGSFTRTAVAESVRVVIKEEEGKIYRDKAKEMRAVIGDVNQQSEYVDNFLDYLGGHKRHHGDH